MTNDIQLSGGQIVHNFHTKTDCLGVVCPVHNPSDHEYRDFPLFFNGKHMIRQISDSDDDKWVVDPDDYYFNKDGQAILKNSAQCLNCGYILISVFRHDFKECSCKNLFVDGGFDYIRRGVKNETQFVELSIVQTKGEE